MSFETVILSNLIFREEYTRKVIAFLETDYFTDKADKIVLTHIKEFINKYKISPTLESLAINITNSNLSEPVMVEVMTLLNEFKPDDNSVEWLFDETETFCKNKALYNAIYKSIEIMNGEEKAIDKNGIPSLLSDALGISFSSNLGHNYWKDSEAHWDKINSFEAKQPMSSALMNKFTAGGIPTGDGSLNCICSPINCGKSIHLIQQAADWIIAGKDVLFISMEMSEAMVRERIDTNIMQMSFGDIKTLGKTAYLSKLNDIRKKTLGNLYVKEYPTGTAHTGHFRHLIQELKIKEGFVPAMVCVDYLTICASATLPHSSKSNSNTFFTSVAENLRALAQELKIPFWTALQLDRVSQGASDAGMGNVALAIGIAATADFMFISMSTPELESMKQVIWKIIKNRYSSYKNNKFLMNLDPNKQKFTDADVTEQAVVMSESELKEMGMPNKIPTGRSSVSTQTMSEWDFN